MIDERELLNLESLPSHLVIVGGGVIGVEFASIFSSFNIKVSVIEYKDNIYHYLMKRYLKDETNIKKTSVDIYNNALVTKVL